MDAMKYNYTEPDYARVYYTWKNSKNQTIHYCAQLETPTVIIFYRCSGGDYNEPDYEVRPLSRPELSPGTTDVDKKINDYIKEYWNDK